MGGHIDFTTKTPVRMAYRKTLLRCFLLLHLLLNTLPRGSAQSWFATGQNANLMLSGVDFNNTGGACFYNHPSGIASDGTRFLLCDRFNNRILVWNQLPGAWNSPPDLVLGQPDFISNNPGDGKHQLNWAGNVSVAANGKLAAADTENDRILLWNSFPTQNAQAADVAISLPGLNPPGSMLNYGWPWGVWTDGTRLAAVATRGGALLFWNMFPTADNQAPDYTIRLPQFGTPRNISTDGSTYFFVGDHNPKVPASVPGTFFWNTYPSVKDQPYDFFRPEWIKGEKTPSGGLVAGGLGAIYVWNAMPVDSADGPDLALNLATYKNGDGPDVLYRGGRLWANNYNGNNVLVFDGIPSGSGPSPAFALCAASPTINTLDSIAYIQNPVLASDGARLIATSDFDRKIYIWNSFPTHSGQQPDQRIALAAQNLHVWDNTLFNNRFVIAARQQVAVWNDAAQLNTPPSILFNTKIGNAVFSDLQGVALDQQFFYLADKHGKLYIWNNLPASANTDPVLTINNPGVEYGHLHSDGVYLTAVKSNPSPQVYIYNVSELEKGNTTPFKTISSSAELPLNLVRSAIAFNGALAIANHSNHSVFLWQDINDAGNPNTVVTLGQTSATGSKAAIGIDRLFLPSTLLAHQNQLWVGEFKFSSRILKYSHTLFTGSDTPADAAAAFEIYPNPASDLIYLKGVLPEDCKIEMYNMLGQCVAELQQANKIPLPPLARGSYLVRITARGSVLYRTVLFVQ